MGNTHWFARIPLARVVVVCGLVSFGAAREVAAEEEDFFERRVRPIFVEHCYSCHGGEAGKAKGGLRLDSKAGVAKGGDSGQPVVVPGEPGKSLLIEAVSHANEELRMPPKKKLAEQQIADLVEWVRLGAPDPRGETAPVVAPGNDARSHWAFQKPGRVAEPAVKDARWAANAIDRFILAVLEAKGLAPSPEADKRTLIRRATYDLTGLPPTVEEVEAFLADGSPGAFEKVVDRLLASPRYGERWARHWLDLARYSDTKGYVYDREERRFIHAHNYRDWVIRAFNEDLPYDQFLLQQIAADQLGDATSEAGNPHLAAMGFLTVGRRFLGIQHEIIDDRIDVVTRTTQGLTVACARCHDHKFDPIPTADYYSLYGVFASSFEKAVVLEANPKRTQAYVAYETELARRVGKLNETFEAKKREVSDRVRGRATQYMTALLEIEKIPSEEFYEILSPDDLNPVIARQWHGYVLQTRGGVHPVFGPWHALVAIPAGEFAAKAREVIGRLGPEDGKAVNRVVREALAAKPPASKRDVAAVYGKLFEGVHRQWREANEKDPDVQRLEDPAWEELRQVLYGPDSPTLVPQGSIPEIEPFFDEKTREALAKLQREIDRWIIEAPGAPPHAVALVDGPRPRNARIFRRGNPAQRGEEVPRQYLALLEGAGRKPFEHGSGRLELARRVASRANPLTARVMVNRVWAWHFGTGLVRTPSDFGTRCEPPTHPELLDWLAVRFMDEGWSIKKLHKRIMLSATYRQGSEGSAELEAADPENRLLGRMNRRRLDFESMRDSLLVAGGDLDLAMGGRPVEMFKAPFAKRRTVYGYVDRQYLPGLLRVFDFANPDLHTPERVPTTVPQQALFFMNSPFLADRARAVANRADVASISDRARRIERMYELLFQRPPTERQKALGLQFIEAVEREPAPPPPPKVAPSAWSYGYGEYDPAADRIKSFEALPHFTGKAWQGGAQWPDGKLGWVQLTAEGGHAGNDLRHAAIRRWTAPRDCTVSVAGTLAHGYKEGDGIRARIVSSRAGQLAMWTLHNQKAETRIEGIAVRKGETLDFVVDLRGGLNSDMFTWAPVLTAGDKPASVASTDEVITAEWNAKKEFRGVAPPPPVPLTAWERYAQVLLLSNEFLFVD